MKRLPCLYAEGGGGGGGGPGVGGGGGGVKAKVSLILLCSSVYAFLAALTHIPCMHVYVQYM